MRVGIIVWGTLRREMSSSPMQGWWIHSPVPFMKAPVTQRAVCSQQWWEHTGCELQSVGLLSPKSGTPILTPRQPKPLSSFNYHHINTDRVSGGCIQTTPTRCTPSPQAPVWRACGTLEESIVPIRKAHSSKTNSSVYLKRKRNAAQYNNILFGLWSNLWFFHITQSL